MDPLSEILSLLKLRSYASGGLDVGGEWSIGIGPHDGIKCYAAVAGECWLAVDGVPDPVRIRTGDCFLLPRGWPFRLASDLALPPVDAMTTYPLVRDGSVITLGGGGNFFCVGGHFALTGEQAGLLLAVLPPIVHIRSEADRAVLRWTLERMRQELRDPQPGGFLVAQLHATNLLVQVLRLHLADPSSLGVGWIFALADRQMNAAISAIHAEPARTWSLQSLAARAGMSRTSFSQRFKETVGQSPMDYLTRWRMLLAANRLSENRDPVSVIAPSLGYQSESAFSNAFKRVMGCSPRQYGRQEDASANRTTLAHKAAEQPGDPLPERSELGAAPNRVRARLENSAERQKVQGQSPWLAVSPPYRPPAEARDAPN